MTWAYWRSKAVSSCIVLANLVLIVCVVMSVVRAFSSAQEVSFSQNIENIQTMTNASAEKIELEFQHHTQELQRVARYINNYHGVGMTREELLDFFHALYAEQDEAHHWELVNSALNESEGLARGFDTVSLCDPASATFVYSAQAYPTLAKIFCASSESTLGSVSYTSEFTDSSPMLEKVSAISSPIRLRTEFGYTYCTLMQLLKSNYVNDLLADNDNLSNLSYFDYSCIIVDDDGNYVISNPQFQGTNLMDYIALYNSSFTQDDANALYERLHQEDYADVLYYDNNRGQACAYTITAVQNSEWHILSLVPLDSFNNEYHLSDHFLNFAVFFGLLFLVDIAFAMFINRKLRRRTSEAQAASEAKTDFLSRMSHDIRTPINVINGMTELAMQEANPPDTQDYLKDIRSSSSFLLGLVNDILDMNKVESGKMELFPKPYAYREFQSYINAIISPMCAAKDIHFTVNCDRENSVLLIDKMRLNQIVFNLLSNAVKFTPRNGHVSLGLTIAPTAKDRALLSICIRDDGIGMSEAFQKNMFSAFAQESQPEQQQSLGTGLGLAIVKNLVEIMGGSIRVESELGHGTTFFIQIEAALVELPAPQEKPSEHSANLRGKRVLLCEDQPMNAKIIVRLLQMQEVQTDTAENGKLGVEKLKNTEPFTYDAVLMDVRMPVMNGLEATKAIRSLPGREDLEHIPIIALTANAYDSDVRACLDAGMNEHLAKPIDKQTLYEALERQIQG